MDSKRPATPPPMGGALPAPSTPETLLPKATIPPSPDRPRFDLLDSPDSAGSTDLLAPTLRSAKLQAVPDVAKRSLTAGVRKPTPKATRVSLDILKVGNRVSEEKKRIGLMDLPGEIRNVIYSFTNSNKKQALLVHRPRLASLRLRTQLDRTRPLPSDLAEKEQAKIVPESDTSRSSLEGKRRRGSATLSRETNRPFFGLTQVCRQLRAEYRPLYMQKQEVGMDLGGLMKYLDTYYYGASQHLNALSGSKDRKIDMPFFGNLTIAIGENISKDERAANGVDVWPFLSIWANSYKVEAGFGRYVQGTYDRTGDGEAKDLYRLFGRVVQQDGRCNGMNPTWRAILRARSLAAVRIHRKPASRAPASRIQSLPRLPSSLVAFRPFIHILFRRDAAAFWMDREMSMIPLGWLEERGFGNMEHFDVKVGVESA